MDLELLFELVNYVPLPAWLLLVFAPRWRWTQRIAHSILMPLLLGIAYSLLLFSDLGGNTDFLSLKGVMAAFDKPQTVIAGWIHYLVFDLFIGAWQLRDAQRRGIHHLFVVPSMLLTFAFGPAGLALYLAFRAVHKRVVTLDETVEAQQSSGS